MSTWSKLGMFAGGVLFGSAGLKVLSSKDAKRCYTHTTAAVLRAKDSIMTTANAIRENCDDILADAEAINQARAAEEDAAVIEDASQDEAENGRIEDACPCEAAGDAVDAQGETEAAE